MTDLSPRTILTGLTPLNRALLVILVVLVGLCVLDVLSVRRAMGREELTRRDLLADIDQTRVLETFYAGLRQKEADLERVLGPVAPAPDQREQMLSRPDRVRALSENHGLSCSWVRPIDDDGASIAAALRGRYEGLCAFLPALAARPDLGRLTRLQVLAGRGGLDIMLNLTQAGSARRGDGEALP
ncbi:hypothetical protein JCM14469_06660 [Desulfatiferula olefinivorans]